MEEDEGQGEGEGEGEVYEEVWSWGAGSDGQLGTGSVDDQLLPQLLVFPSTAHPISQIACGGAHAIALTGSRVLTWGRGSCGQLGHGYLGNCLKPKAVEFFDRIVIRNVSAGWNHSGFVSDSGCLFTCGDGSFGQLGHGDYQSHSSPVEVSFFTSKHVEQIACGMRHSLVLLKGPSGDSVFGFGSGRRGQLGIAVDKGRKSISHPQAIDGFKDGEVIAVNANGDHSAALCANGDLYIWGRGFVRSSDGYTPQILPSPLKFTEVALGWNHALILTDGGEVFMLGQMLGGQEASLEQQMPPCDHPPCTSSSEACRTSNPIRVTGINGVKIVSIAAGAEHSALVTENGRIMTCGWGEHGQLGLGDTCNRTSPQRVSLRSRSSDAPSGFRVYCGSGFTIAIGGDCLHSLS